MRDKDVEAEGVRFQMMQRGADANGLENAVAVLRANIQNNLENRDRIRRELEQQEGRADSIGAQIAERKERLEALVGELDALAAELSAKQGEAEETARSAGTLAGELEELRREDPLPPPEQDREQSKARVLAGVKRQLRRKKLCFSARVLAGAAALGVAVWLLVFRFQTPIPYSQDIRIQEVEPAFHMKYLGRDYAGLEVLFRVTEEGGETIRRVYLCYTGSLWTRYLSPGSPYHESVGINNGIVLDTRHGTVIPLPFDGGADQVWYLAGDLEELEDLDEASFQAQAGDAVLLWERQG